MGRMHLSIISLAIGLFPAAVQGLAGEARAALPTGAITRLDVPRPKPSVPGLDGQVFAVRFSPNGQEVFTSGQTKQIHRWNLEGKLLGSFAGPNHFHLDLALSPDGNTIAAQADNLIIVLYDALTGKERARFPHPLPPNTLAHSHMCFLFASDGKHVISAPHGIDPFIRAWIAETGKEVYKIDVGKLGVYNPAGLALSPDGRLLYAAHGLSCIKVYDAATGKEVRRIAEHQLDMVRMALSPDGRRLAAIANEVHIWDAATGTELRRLPRPSHYWVNLAFSPDGRTLATLGDDKPVRLWEVATGQLRLEIAGHGSDVLSMAFSPDGRLLATGGRDAKVLLWNLRELASVQEKAKIAAFEQLWIDLASEDAKAAFRAVCRMQGDGDKTVAALEKRLGSRAGKALQQLIAQLDDDDFQTRERAFKELLTVGQDAEAALAKALLTTTSTEARNRIRAIQERLDRGEGKAIGRLRSLRILEVLEGVNTPAARKLLDALAGGVPDAEVTLEARASFKRVAERRK